MNRSRNLLQEDWVTGIGWLGRIGIVLLVTWSCVLLDSGPVDYGMVPGVSPGKFIIRGSFGPYSTLANQGYESRNVISPIIPHSYDAIVSPRFIGVQFVGDNTQSLATDHLRLKVSGRWGAVTTGSLRYMSDGFVGVRLVKALPPGPYTVRFTAPGFQTPVSVWTIRVTPWSASEWEKLRPYEAAIGQTSYLNALNILRSRLGEPAVIWSRSLALAAAAHARYVHKNGYQSPSFHVEDPSKPAFSGFSPWDRDMAFGWQSPLDGEVGIEWTQSAAPVTVIQNLTDTVFHRLSILSPNVVAAGAGQAAGPKGAVVMDLGFGYRPTLPLAVAYPAPGQSGVSTGWIDIENPDPVAGGFSHQFGYPITVDFPTVARLSDVHALLITGNSPVSADIDAPGVHGMAWNQLGIVPSHILRPDTRYDVSVQARARFNNQKEGMVHLRWHFTTGGSDQSVAVDVTGHNKLTVSVVKAGNGAPVQNEAVQIFADSPKTMPVALALGVTNSAGLMTCHLPRPSSGEIVEAVTGSGNSTQFWW